MGPRCLAFALVLSWAASTAEARDWWVDASNPNCPGSGTPEDPFCKIQDAIDAAESSDRIWIQPGSYTEALSIAEKALSLLGAREGVQTVVEPSVAGTSILRVAGSLGVLVSDLTFVDGLGQHEGGGVSVEGSEVEFRNCSFLRCLASLASGGALAAGDSTVIFRDCVLASNSSSVAVNRGGAVFVERCRLMMYGCSLTENESGFYRDPGYGGAVYAKASECLIVDSEFLENESSSGGALYFDECEAELLRCRIEQNRSIAVSGISDGGGIYSKGGRVIIRESLICGNSTYDAGPDGRASGGGVFGAALLESTTVCHNSAQGIGLGAAPSGFSLGGGAASVRRIASCLFVENRAIAFGGIFAQARGGGAVAEEIIACTFVGNEATAEASWEQGTVEVSGGGAFVTRTEDSILWDNLPDQLSSQSVSFSDVMGGALGPGNIAEDPLFMGPEDFRLSCKSPCVDSGEVEDELLLPLLDASGQNYRVIGRGIDMGAYETGIRWIPKVHHKGPRQLVFECQSPVLDPAVLASIFVSLEQVKGGVVVPDGTGRTLDLSLDLVFRLWLELPAKHRAVSLQGCEGASTVPLEIPGNLPPGLAIYFGGLALDQKTGTILSVSDIERLVLE